ETCYDWNEAKHVLNRNMFYSSQANHVSLHLSETCFHLFKQNMLDSFEAKHDRIMNPQETQQVAARDEKWVFPTHRFERSQYQLTNHHDWEPLCTKGDKHFIQFLYTNKKKCTVNVEVFRKILNICPRVKVVDFTDVPDDDIAFNFLIDLGYKGPVNRHTNMFVDHMIQPWRPLAAIIIHCASMERLPVMTIRKVRIVILWGHAIEINVVILMLTDAIKRSESYQMFIKYSTNQIPPKKSRGKGSKGKKTAEESQETVDVSEESEHEPEPAKKKTSGKRRVKKKVTLSSDDNIISDDPDAALELAKSISQNEAEEANTARKVHATHARMVTESVPESAKKKSSGRSSKSVVIQDTLSTLKSKPATSKTKLKGAPSLTPQEQEAADIIQPAVPDESTVVSATSSEGTGVKPGVPDEDKDITEEKVILEWGDEQD
ncbi:hypothetical protein Tco_0926905, partial [Tanacetum coccineum]